MALSEVTQTKFITPSESNPATEGQQKLIDHIRKNLAHPPDKLTDLQCLQFSRRHEVEKEPVKDLEQGLKKYFETFPKVQGLKWDTVLEEEKQWQDWLKAFGFGQDKEGHPVFYLQLSKTNNSEVSNNLEMAEKFYIRLYHRLFHFNAVRSEKTGVLQYQSLFVLDFDGVSMWSAAKQIGTLKSLTQNLNSLYPEVAFRTLFINTPSTISWVTGAITPFLGARTKNKMKISSGIDDLKELVDDSERPAAYGGTATKAIVYLDYTPVSE